MKESKNTTLNAGACLCEALAIDQRAGVVGGESVGVGGGI